VIKRGQANDSLGYTTDCQRPGNKTTVWSV